MRQRRGEQPSRSRVANDALARPGPVELGRGGRRRRARSAAAKRLRQRHQTTRRHAGEAGERRRPAGERGTRQKSSPPTSPIRMFCGLPMMVAAEPALAPPASAITNGRGSRPRRSRPGAQHRRHREHDHVVGEHRREDAAGRDRQREQRRGRQPRCSRSAPSTSRRSRRRRTGPRGPSARTGRPASGSRSPPAPPRRRPRRCRRAAIAPSRAMPVRSTLSPGQRPSAMPR